MSSALSSQVTDGIAAAAAAPHALTERPRIDPLGVLGTAAGQWTFLPINGAAFMLQVMHPVIGDIVGEYSVAFTDPVGRAIRSMDSVQRWHFGGESAWDEGFRLRASHQPLQMTGSDGKHISALNPEAYGWVIGSGTATILDSVPITRGRPLSAAETRQVLADCQTTADVVQVPQGQFPTDDPAAFWAYYDEMVSERLEAHPVALALLDDLANGHPPVPPTAPAFAHAAERVLRPLGIAASRATYYLTIGVLRPEVREILGVTWTRKDERAYTWLNRSMRGAYKVLPERIGYTPLAYHARAHARALGAMHRRDLPDFTAHRGEAKAARAAAGCPF